MSWINDDGTPEILTPAQRTLLRFIGQTTPMWEWSGIQLYSLTNGKRLAWQIDGPDSGRFKPWTKTTLMAERYRLGLRRA